VTTSSQQNLNPTTQTLLHERDAVGWSSMAEWPQAPGTGEPPTAHRRNRCRVTRSVRVRDTCTATDFWHSIKQGTTGRTGEALTDPEPIRSLHEQFSSLGVYEAHVVDSSTMTPETTADTILQGIARGTYLLDPGGGAPRDGR
jgi:hypothetical protein